MRLRILGCSGGELRRHRTTCFLVDGVLAVDAGALTGTLPLAELLKVDDIILTHSHFDHVKDVPLLADLLVGRRRTPVRVHASTACARTAPCRATSSTWRRWAGRSRREPRCAVATWGRTASAA